MIGEGRPGLQAELRRGGEDGLEKGNDFERKVGEGGLWRGRVRGCRLSRIGVNRSFT